MFRLDSDFSERHNRRRLKAIELSLAESAHGGYLESVDQIINIRVSDAKLRDLKEKPSLTRKLKKIFGVHEPMTVEEFDHQIKRLYKCCLKSIRDLHELHLRRSIGMDILEDIVNRAEPEYLTISHVVHLIWCNMSCMHHFQLRLRTSESGLVSWARKRKSERCIRVYQKLIKIFDRNMYRIAVNAIITFYREGKLWEIEFACTDLIIEILQIHQFVKEDPNNEGGRTTNFTKSEENYLLQLIKKYGHILNLDDIVYTIEIATMENTEEAKYLTKILCEIMKGIKSSDVTMYILIHIINMLENSIKPRPSDVFNYVCLKKGMEICIRHAIKILDRRDLIQVMIILINKMNCNANNKEIVVCFGNIAVYTANNYNRRGGKRPFIEGPLPMVLTLFRSKATLMTLFGLKIWQRIIDRGENAKNFFTPKIFFRDCDYNIVSRRCHPSDKALFKKVRHLLYGILFNSFLVCDNKAKLEDVYKTIALTLIEIPCGYSVSCVVTIAMSIQEYAFSIMSSNLVRAHHLHAIVLALLTLICHIHRATVFYQYVNMIIERRAEWAPHLNPPLKMQYEYSQHHILWNKPELFFEDWEARYGLWKCFRGHIKSAQRRRASQFHLKNESNKE